MRRLIRLVAVGSVCCALLMGSLRLLASASTSTRYGCLHLSDWMNRAWVLDTQLGIFAPDKRVQPPLRPLSESTAVQLPELTAADLPDLPPDSQLHNAPHGNVTLLESISRGFYGVLYADGRQFITPNANYRFVGWSADGARAALIERRYGENYATLLALDLATQHYEIVRRRVWTGGQFTSDTLGGERQRVLVPYRLSQKEVALDLMDLDGQKARRLMVENTFYRWWWSPDDRFAAVLNGVESATRLLIVQADGSAVHEVGGLQTIHAVFWQADGQLAYVGRQAERWQVGVADPNSGAHHSVFSLPAFLRLKPDYFLAAPKGSAMVVSVERRVYVGVRDGVPHLLARGQSNAFAWSPDGGQLARLFVPEGMVNPQLQILLADGTEVRRLAAKRSLLRGWSNCG